MTLHDPTATGAAATTTSSSVLRGSAWSLAARGLPQAYVLLISVIAARYLGPEGMGRQSYIAFIAISATMLFTGGLSVSLMRFIGETLGRGEPAAVRDLIRWGWAIAVISALIGGGTLVVAALAGSEPQNAWVLAGVGTSLGILHAIPSALLIGAQRWRDASLVGLITGTVSVPAVLIVLQAGGGITGLFAVEAVVAAVNLGWTSLLARRALDGLTADPASAPAPPSATRSSAALRRRTGAYALLLSLNVLLSVVVYKRSEFFFLDHYATDSEIAIYSIAFAATSALALLPEALTSAAVPAFATLFGAGEIQRLSTGFTRGVRMLAIASLPVTAAMLALGPATLQLVYGGDYAGTEPVLRIMLIVSPVLPLLNVSYALMLGLGRIKAVLFSNAAAAAVNVTLALILVPRYDAQGAAVANGAAQLVVAVLVLGYTRRMIGPFDTPWGSLAKTLLASAAGGLAAFGIVSALPGLAGCVLGLLAGAASFTGLARLLRFLPPDDAEWLAEMAGERRGGSVARAIRVLSPAPRVAGRP
jgi:O-antigen/teichoic acid export membrane protein